VVAQQFLGAVGVAGQRGVEQCAVFTGQITVGLVAEGRRPLQVQLGLLPQGSRNDGGGGGPQLNSPWAPSNTSGFSSPSVKNRRVAS
jgi:hypothetical protein